MLSTKTFLSFCLLFGIISRIDCDELALSTTLYKHLTEIFQNLRDVNWRALHRLYVTGADYLGLGLTVASNVGKSVSTTFGHANRNIFGRTRNLTSRSVDYVRTGLQKGVGNLSKWLHRLSSIFEDYGQKLSQYSKSPDNRRK